MKIIQFSIFVLYSLITCVAFVATIASVLDKVNGNIVWTTFGLAGTCFWGFLTYMASKDCFKKKKKEKCKSLYCSNGKIVCSFITDGRDCIDCGRTGYVLRS